MNKTVIGIVSGVVMGSAITATLAVMIWPEKPNDGSIVPEFADVKNIVIDGEKMTASEFADRYCRGKPKHTFKDESYCGTAIKEALYGKGVIK